MSTGAILLLLGVFYFFAHALTFVFHRTRVPDVLILVIVGILIGPAFGFADPEDFGRMGSVMIVIALAVILFESGTSLKLAEMASSLPSTLALTFTTAFLTTIIIALATVPFFDGDFGLALLTGTILAGTSSAVVIPMVQSLKMSDRPGTILVLESALTDVICIILVFAFLEAIEQGSFSVGTVTRQVVSSLGFAALIGVLGGLAWLMIWEKVRKLPSSVFTTIAFAFVLYGVSEILQVSGAIATLAFGVTLANLPSLVTSQNLPKISESERSFYREIVFLLKLFFFIYLGVSTRISDFAIIATSVILVFVLYFMRAWVTRFTLTREGTSFRDAALVSVMIPKGLTAAVLTSLLVQRGIPGAETVQIIVFAVVIFSIFLTAILVPLLEGPLRRIYRSVLRPFADDQPE